MHTPIHLSSKHFWGCFSSIQLSWTVFLLPELQKVILVVLLPRRVLRSGPFNVPVGMNMLLRGLLSFRIQQSGLRIHLSFRSLVIFLLKGQLDRINLLDSET